MQSLLASQAVHAYQRYLPLSGREKPPEIQLAKRDRAEFGTEREAGDKGCSVFSFQEESLLGRAIHLGLGEVRAQQGHRLAGSSTAPSTQPKKIKEQCVCFLPRV
jgi:hypothetical protein